MKYIKTFENTINPRLDELNDVDNITDQISVEDFEVKFDSGKYNI